MEFTDQQRRDVLMLRGLNHTYSEIASALSDRYSQQVSADQVGRVVREMEDDAAERGADEVFDEIVLHGYLSDELQT